ncbi:MAG: hypothetical protein HN730_10320, partial [Bdellovibrionales bacterium]|nr:hypothetical protein [Bdellovibrionales bacterium]
MKKTLVIICFLLSSLSVFATTGSSVCPNTLESIPILQGGRVKPLHVHAKETIKYLTGKSKFEKRSPTQTYCLLSFGTLDIKDKIDLKVRIEHVEVRKLLGVDSNNPLLSYSALTAKEGLIKSAAMRLKEENSYRKALNVIFGKIQTYKEIQRGGNWFIATAVDKAVKWKPVSEFFTQLKSREDVIAFHLT